MFLEQKGTSLKFYINYQINEREDQWTRQISHQSDSKHTHTHTHVQAWRILTALGKTFCITLLSSRLEGGKMMMTKWVIVEPEDVLFLDFNLNWDDEVNMLTIALKGQKTNPNRRHGKTDKTSGKYPIKECCWAQTWLPCGTSKAHGITYMWSHCSSSCPLVI